MGARCKIPMTRQRFRSSMLTKYKHIDVNVYIHVWALLSESVDEGSLLGWVATG